MRSTWARNSNNRRTSSVSGPASVPARRRRGEPESPTVRGSETSGPGDAGVCLMLGGSIIRGRSSRPTAPSASGRAGTGSVVGGVFDASDDGSSSQSSKIPLLMASMRNISVIGSQIGQPCPNRISEPTPKMIGRPAATGTGPGSSATERRREFKPPIGLRTPSRHSIESRHGTAKAFDHHLGRGAIG